MAKDVDLNEIRRKVYMSFFEDGLWDICLGLFIVGWGLAILTEAAYLPGISFIGLYFIGLYFAIWGIKKWVTYPRIGYVRFSATSRRRITARFVILGTVVFLLGLLAAVLWGIGTRPQWLADYFPLIFNGMLAAIVCFVAYWARASRFYLHAALIFLGAVFHLWVGIRWEFGFIGAGGIIVLIGLGLLISFLRKYPKIAEEVQGEDWQ
jgi:hypothetical protein